MIYFTLVSGAFLFSLTDVNGLSEHCTKNSDCDTKNAICISGTCSCDELSHYNDTLCLPYATEYNAFCYEQSQCEKYMGGNSDCKNNRCVCDSKFRWYKGQCRAYVDKGENCETSDDCYNGYDLLSLSCIFGKCTCSADYYDRGHDCRKSSVVFGDCALKSDCKPILNINSVCSLGKCVSSNKTSTNSELHLQELNEETKEVKRIILAEIEDSESCEKDDDCRDMANSICDVTKRTCGCVEETHYLYNGNCVPGLNRCSTVEDCTNNTICFENTCICKQGFFLKDHTCIAELGVQDTNANYETDTDCPIKPGKLSGSTCYCKSYWFNDDSNRNCIKTMIEQIQSCLTNEWCNAMGPYSFCNSTTSMCECSSFAKLNRTTFYCDKVGDPTEDMCLRDNECKINERCVDEKCECVENFARNEDQVCLPNIGASCEFASCNHIGNSSCLSRACICDEHFVEGENRCLKLADNLKDNCEAQEQCQNIQHAVCTATDDGTSSACVCGEEYIAINSTCYQSKKYGDPCMTQIDCTRVLNRSYLCRNSICQCSVGFELKNGYCTSSASALLGGYALLLIVAITLVVN